VNDAPIVSWVLDPVLAGFEAVTIPLPSADDGALVATLVRKRARNGNGRAVLHVHGFVDYFFHAHVAEFLNARGWDVYALDLRRSGRSLRAGNRPYFVRDLREYDQEITLAISVITSQPGHRLLCLMGHSTGGLAAALYMHNGASRDRVQALVLNSPFMDFNASALERAALRVVTTVGGVMSTLPIPGVLSPAYVQSLHRDFRGEWSFDLRWKPERGFPAYAGWLRAVRAGQVQVAQGLAITVPVLLLRSTESLKVRGWDDRMHVCDGVLNVDHMHRSVPKLGRSVTEVPIAQAVHDVFLSRAAARQQALGAYGDWIDALSVPLALPSRR
jgi:alpha-beta hydrolase superfamily lysophospholipase